MMQLNSRLGMQVMSEDEPQPSFPPEKRERLVYIFYAKRASFLFYYVFGTAVTAIGMVFMVATAYGLIARNLVSWYLGLAAMLFGATLIILAEVRKRYNLYIITTWNVRIRKGVIERATERVYYDQITRVETTSDREEEIAEMGDVCIYTDDSDSATLVFRGIHNPEGVAEIIRRFVQTVKDPPDWDHMER
jgi:hypothetical protein